LNGLFDLLAPSVTGRSDLTDIEADAPHIRDKALAVRLGETVHAIPIAAVEEVLPALPVERIPQCPTFVRGVISVRGHLVPVLDAAERLGLTDHQRPAEPHIVCVRVADRLVGVEVDEALDLVDLRGGTRVTAEALGATRGFFSGAVELAGEIVRLLDPAGLLQDDQALQLKRISNPQG
jgi:purine-binding chemotaxis protein CheW